MSRGKEERHIEDYADIIDLPHHVSRTRPHMSLQDRAAQFSPFAALTGHDAAIQETARLTEQRMELDEDMKVQLDEKLRWIQRELGSQPLVSVTYFKPDARKEGGAYVSVSGNVKKFDLYAGEMILTDGTQILLDDIIEIY